MRQLALGMPKSVPTCDFQCESVSDDVYRQGLLVVLLKLPARFSLEGRIWESVQTSTFTKEFLGPFRQASYSETY